MSNCPPKGYHTSCCFKKRQCQRYISIQKNEEFLAQKNGVIATGSLRRKAQWLNRYPSHKIEGLRGNINTRLKKLNETNNWNGAIFAAAGLGRIGLTPKNSVNLEWMVPAPGQGAIMIACLEANHFIKEACLTLNDADTEICTSIERSFPKYFGRWV